MGVETGARVGGQLQHRAVELHDLVVVGADDEPRPAARAAPALAVAVDAPLAGHAQMRVQRQVALEADEQVLAVGVHRPHAAVGQLLAPALAAGTRVRRLERADLPPGQRRSHPLGGVVDRVPLGHALILCGGRRFRLLWRWEAPARPERPHAPRSSSRRDHRLAAPRAGRAGGVVGARGSAVGPGERVRGRHVGVRASQPGDALGPADVHPLRLPVAERRGGLAAGSGRRVAVAGRRPRAVAESRDRLDADVRLRGRDARARRGRDAVALGVRRGPDQPDAGHAGSCLR